ncbi:MAG: indolepyruvate oxidoreductase subunit beta [Proteobacteria bacterium]|nr:indolepyruvate oxidoreductase subunit beta [Pseudomonadota bacterium]
MQLNLIITGVGGQGNVLASQVLGHAAVHKGLFVTIGETFGLSQRGGPVLSHIRLSDTALPGPIIPPNAAHMVVGLEPLEPVRILQEFGNEDTVFIVNSRPIHPLNVIAGDAKYPDDRWLKNTLECFGKKLYWLDATELAISLGGAIMLNMIMLGALSEMDGFPISKSDIKDVIRTIFPESKLEMNHKALDLGSKLVQNA